MPSLASALCLAAASLLCLLPGAFAPFPADHPYNMFNPVIEPWWERLTKEEQKHIYAGWERVEPVAIALADAVEAKIRAKETLRRLVVTNAKHVIEVAKEAYEASKKKDGGRDVGVEDGNAFRTPALELGEAADAEKQELVHWKGASKGAKRLAVLEKINFISNEVDGKKF